MFKKIFLDANILLDIYDPKRPHSFSSRKALISLMETENTELFTSCDLISTFYYIRAKTDKEQALSDIEQINSFCTVVEFGNREVSQACELMKTNPNFTDLEDTLQYFMAKKVNADLILSNDAGFVSESIEIIGAEAFCRRRGI